MGRAMDGSTILFIGENFSKGFNLEYLNNNFGTISPTIQDTTEIYYKANPNRDSWFNYKLASKTQVGNYVERIIKGLANLKLSQTLEEIPETEFVDINGYKFNISPRDGLDLGVEIIQKVHIDLDTISREMTLSGELRVNFDVDITNAFISFNGLYEPYVLVSPTEILYMTTDSFTLPDDALSARIVPYVWDNVKRTQVPRTPLSRENSWFIFEEEITPETIITYNGVIYYPTVNKHNSKRVQIPNIDLKLIDYFDLDKIKAYDMSMDESDGLKMMVNLGINNEIDNNVRFPANIGDSLITYNGIDHEYTVNPDEVSIVYSMYDVSDVIDTAKIYSVNFYTGDLEMGSFQSPISSSSAHLIETYEELLRKYTIYINELSQVKDIIVDDFNDLLTFNPDEPNVFDIQHIPQIESTRLYINTMYYDEDDDFVVDYENKKLIWMFSEANGGFDLSNDFEILAVYDYYIDPSPVPSVS